ncbi:hypothetical protein K491DRAFT_459326 [Lophiostoma macrostomum CBS 122681]|uniref:Uncharacterized protein n=1 Tax=Lophiostoma macrostomum CBS 122681 TaxID=1314788 RepID=A0A6A6T487_9PLEO|nr:hypothetical protein K491DRAFT_459326 [Lophiostoma macrostomum CBS 122681]
MALGTKNGRNGSHELAQDDEEEVLSNSCGEPHHQLTTSQQRLGGLTQKWYEVKALVELILLSFYCAPLAILNGFVDMFED